MFTSVDKVADYFVMYCDHILVSLLDTTASSSVQDATFDLSNLSNGVRSSDLEELRRDIVKCLTDGLFKKLLDMEQVRTQT